MSDRRAVIVAVTAFSEVRQVPEFETAEFDDFLVKPIELPVVRRTVEKWLLDAGAKVRGGLTDT